MDLSTIASSSTLGALLKSAPLSPLENRILIAYALQLTRVQLITQSERIISANEAHQLSALFARRLAGEPIAYIVGIREFYGLDFEVTPDVLIPRPETELLVELVLSHLQIPDSTILDMGTGSGAIAVTVAVESPHTNVTALDASKTALTVAMRNAQRHQQERIQFLHSDWFSAVAEQRFDIIVSNPPYIEQHDHHLSEGDVRFEPIDALTDHADGLSDLRQIIQHAPAHLTSSGWLFLEHGYDQSVSVRTLLQQAGFTQVQSWRDLAGIERVSGGQYQHPTASAV